MSPASAAPRKSVQILVWLFAAFAVLGVAALTSLPAAGSALDASSAPAATSTALPAAQPTSIDSNTSLESMAPLAATDDEAEEGSGQDESTCNTGAGTASYLPAMRWSDFSLSVWDDGFIVKANAILSSFASFLFFVGDIMWKILFFFLNFGITFQPLCTTAGTINTVVADLGMLASWFMIPVFGLFIFKHIKSLARMQIGRMIGGVITLAAIVGTLFFITDTAKDVEGKDNETILTTTGTVPWAADTLMGFFSTAYTSINGISGVFGTEKGSEAAAFTDTNSAGATTCNQYVKHLYKEYNGSLGDSSGSTQAGVMTQMSGIWEKSYLTSWMQAQFGSSGDNFFPSQVACRHLEATVDTSNTQKENLFNGAHGLEYDVIDTGLVYLMQPLGDLYRLPVDMLWAGCQYVDEEWVLSPGASQAVKDENFPCSDKWRDGGGAGADSDRLPMNTKDGVFKGKNELVKQLGQNNTILYLETGEDDIKKFIGYEPDSDAPANRGDHDAAESLGWFRDFASASIGGNIGDRIGQGLISAVIGVIYLWTFGPAALGLTIVGFALLVLLALVPLALLLWAFGQQSGPKMLKLTGAATAVTFVFGLMLSLLSTLIHLFNTVVSSIVGETGFISQILLAAAPIAAVLLLKKILQMMGLGNITSLSGALGLTSAMAAKAAGSRNSDVVSNAANRGMDAAKRAGLSGARGLGAGLSAMRKGGPSPLQRLAEGRMGKSALGRKAIAGMQNAASKAKKAKDAVGSIVKDRAQSASEEFGQTRAGTALNRGKQAFANSGFGQGLQKAAGVVGGLAKNKTARYGAALTAGAGVGVAAGAFGAGAIPLAVAATGALPLGRAIAKKTAATVKGVNHERLMKSGRFNEADDGSLVLKDDSGNDIVGARQLAYARANGLMSKADVANQRIADRALRNMTPEEQGLYTSNFERAQIAGLPTSQAHAVAKKQAIEARNYISKLKTPEEREAALNTYTHLTLDAVRSSQNGAASAGGMHPGFAGYDNEIARQIGLETIASKLGVEKDQVVLGTHGLAVPAATLAETRMGNGAPALGNDATMELASHPALYLDSATVKRSSSETDEQYSARITATLAARGLLDDNGKAVDVFKAHGVDVHTTEGANRVSTWLDGGNDQLLSSIEYTKVKGEDGMVKAAQKWTNDNTLDHAERQWGYMVNVMGTREMALSDTANIGAIPVAVDASNLNLQAKPTPDISRSLGKIQLDQADVDTQVIPMQAPTGTSGAATQRISVAAADAQAANASAGNRSVIQELVTPVTLAETVTHMRSRRAHMSEWIDEVGNNESPKPLEDRMRNAARSLQGVQDMERETGQMLEGLRSSTYARAALSVDHFAASNPEQASHSQLKIMSEKALDRAEQESEDRESILSRKLSDLFRSTSVAQNSPNEDDRRQAFRDVAQKLTDIEETSKALYQEEEKTAREMREAAHAAFGQLGEALEAGTASHRGPNRSVVKSTNYLEDMARRRNEEFSDA